MSSLIERAEALFAELDVIDDVVEKIELINQLKVKLWEHSPMKHHPVDCVTWHPEQVVKSNDYNPNRQTTREFKRLQKSIQHSNYTMPVVSWDMLEFQETVDGFHRGEALRANTKIRQSTHGYLPLAIANRGNEYDSPAESRAHRMVATILQNTSGTEKVDLKRDVVRELCECGMGDNWVLKKLEMDADELLRFKQLSGLASLFENSDFTRAWVRSPSEAAFYGVETHG